MSAAASAVRRRLLRGHEAGLWTDPEVRALRITGAVDHQRLRAAIHEVTAALPALRFGYTALPHLMEPQPVERPATVAHHDLADERDPQQACVGLLDIDRRKATDPVRDALVRFHIARLAEQEWVLGLVADPLALDLRSVYQVLGAVVQAYLGRFRPDEHPEAAHAVASTVPGTPRWRWWERRLSTWTGREPLSAVVRTSTSAANAQRTAILPLDGRTWARLTSLTDDAGNAGTLSIVALLMMWLRAQQGAGGPAVFGGTLDLRDLLGLGAAVGPLTERIVYEVDQTDVDQLSFPGVVRRVHAGMLDAVVHHTAYDDLIAIADACSAPSPDQYADIVVHYCRTPPASGHTRDDPGLRRYGLSIELFAESDLASPRRPEDVRPAGAAAVELRVAEHGTGMALLVDHDAARVSPAVVDGLLSDLGSMIPRFGATPAVPPS
ncbi:hypothetical protein ACFPM7_15570 [Actinokineospora guangxiensis]|uniref:Condensation domain-containing protein n=1 Tax=Actinokineospora guangxiensis TaxID=1490288 RepID=A0ABW0ER26_9PSEU